jgi:PAS domain S-box-containing protein
MARNGDAGRDEPEETIADTAASLLMFENAALPLLVIAPNGQIVMANRALRALLGYEFSDLVGQPMSELAEPDGRPWSLEERLLGGRVTPERRTRLRRGDGSKITVRGSSVLVTDSEGVVRYIVARSVPEGR